MSVPVVADAGPLIALSKLNVLPLLHLLYGQVLLPDAVYLEAVSFGERLGYEDARTLRSYFERQGWRPVSGIAVGAELEASKLDKGEKESLALAAQSRALLLVDDESARHEARRRGVPVRGTLGVLIEAYRRGFLNAEQLRFYFQQLESRPDIWISPSLCRRLLHETLGE